MTELEKLKQLIDEENYPYFDDKYLEERLGETDDIYQLAQELCLIKAGIEEIKLGDIIIPSPKNHFLLLAKKYRKNQNRVAVRADEY